MLSASFNLFFIFSTIIFFELSKPTNSSQPCPCTVILFNANTICFLKKSSLFNFIPLISYSSLFGLFANIKPIDLSYFLFLFIISLWYLLDTSKRDMNGKYSIFEL